MSTAAAAPAPRPRLSAGWGLLFFAVALAAVAVAIAFHRAGSGATRNAPTLVVPGSAFNVVRGTGHREGDVFVVEPSTEKLVTAAANVPPFSAVSYPRVQWNLRSPLAPTQLAFIWRTHENPSRTYSVPLQWLGDNVAPLHMAGVEGWHGTVTGVALVARNGLRVPLQIVAIGFPAASTPATLRTMLAQWGRFYPLRGFSSAYPFDVERADDLPLAMAVAAALALALGLAFVIARRSGRRVDLRFIGIVFVGGWLLLDLRWTTNLWQEVRITAHRYGGKTAEQKALAQDDGPLYAVARQVARLLPRTPTRIAVLCDNGLIALRIAHYLYPHSVAYSFAPQRERGHRFEPSAFRAGDYVLLFFASQIAFDPREQRMVWPDGRTLPAEAVLSQPNTLLLRVRAAGGSTP